MLSWAHTWGAEKKNAEFVKDAWSEEWIKGWILTAILGFSATGEVHNIGQGDAMLILTRLLYDDLHVRQCAGPGPLRNTWVRRLTCWTVAIFDSSGCIRVPSIFQPWTFFRLARHHFFMRKINLTSRRRGRTPLTQPQHDQKCIYGVFPRWCDVLKCLQASSGSSHSSFWASCNPRRLYFTPQRPYIINFCLFNKKMCRFPFCSFSCTSETELYPWNKKKKQKPHSRCDISGTALQMWHRVPRSPHFTRNLQRIHFFPPLKKVISAVLLPPLQSPPGEWKQSAGP